MIKFDLGRVVSVDTTAVDANGNPTPKVNVQSFTDGGTVSIPLASVPWDQSTPVTQLHCLFIRYGSQWSRAVKFWGIGETTARKGVYALDPGEVFIQAASGLGYLHIDSEGNVNLVTGDTTSSLALSDDGFNAAAVAFSMVTPGGASIQVGTDGSIVLQQKDGSNVLASVNMDADNNVSIFATGDVSIKGANIYLDGQVYAGPNATDETARLAFGQAVTTGPNGSYPFEYATGMPVPGSQSVLVGA